MKIIFILKDNINRRPPILSIVQNLLDLHYEIVLITTGINSETLNELNKKGCKCIILDCSPHFLCVPRIKTVYSWLLFRKQVFSIIQSEQFDYLWIGSGDATLALGTELLKFPYILQIQELYDTVPRYRKGLELYMHHAVKVFVPEEVRAHIFRAWYHLKETPVVLPNKPYGHPGRRNLPITNQCAAEAFAKIPENSKILFYQGIIEKVRDLRPFAKAVCQMEGKIVLAIQGKIIDKKYFDDLVHQFPIYYIPYVPAPNHLEITSHADFGLLSYDHINLNYEFCAPNKIWEYSGFGIPMLGNDVFGLQNLTEHYHAGVSVNFEQCCTTDIVRALQILLENQEEYSSHALEFFNSINVKKIITDAIS